MSIILVKLIQFTFYSIMSIILVKLIHYEFGNIMSTILILYYIRQYYVKNFSEDDTLYIL